MSKYKFIIVLLIISFNQTFSQVSENDIINKYKGEYAVVLKKKKVLNIKLKKGELEMCSDNYKGCLILRDNAEDIIGDYIYSNNFEEVEDIEAFILSKKKIKIIDFEIQNDFNSSSFYDDSKRVKISFPKTEPQDKTVVTYKTRVKEYLFWETFYFGSYINELSSEFSVKFPKEVKINYKLFNERNNKITFSETKNKKYTTYTWKAKEIPKIEYLKADFPANYYQTHIVIYIEEYKKSDGLVKVYSDLKDLCNLYHSWTNNVNNKNETSIKALSDSLTRSINEPVEIIKKLYYWVQNEIKYVAFSDGYSGLIPDKASAVLSKRYGDCKGKSNLLSELLKAKGIKCNLTWIGTRRIPYSYKELPVPMVDNHVIVALNHKNKYYFLDATEKFLAFGVPAPEIQGKEAMIVFNKDSFIIKKIEPVEKEHNTLTDSIFLKINNDILQGEGVLTSKGYFKSELCYSLYKKSEKSIENAMKIILEKGNNKFILKSYNYNKQFDMNSELKINYSFDLPNYQNKYDSTIYINLNIEKPLFNSLIDSTNQYFDHKIDYKQIRKNVYVLNIPKGYENTYIPENSEFTSDKFGFSINYSKFNENIILTQELYINTIAIKEKHFSEWNRMIKKLNKSYSESLAVKKK